MKGIYTNEEVDQCDIRYHKSPSYPILVQDFKEGTQEQMWNTTQPTLMNVFQLLKRIKSNMVEEHVVIIRFNKDNPMNSSSHTPLFIQQQCGQPNKATSQKAKGTQKGLQVDLTPLASFLKQQQSNVTCWICGRDHPKKNVHKKTRGKVKLQ